MDIAHVKVKYPYMCTYMMFSYACVQLGNHVFVIDMDIEHLKNLLEAF